MVGMDDSWFFVFTAPVAELTVVSFTVPLDGWTIAAIATVVFVLFVDRLPCYGGVCVAMSCGGWFLSPVGTYDSVWDSVKPVTGNYFFYYFQYPVFVVCVCLLNYWFSSYYVICPDIYFSGLC